MLPPNGADFKFWGKSLVILPNATKLLVPYCTVMDKQSHLIFCRVQWILLQQNNIGIELSLAKRVQKHTHHNFPTTFSVCQILWTIHFIISKWHHLTENIIRKNKKFTSGTKFRLSYVGRASRLHGQARSIKNQLHNLDRDFGDSTPYNILV